MGVDRGEPRRIQSRSTAVTALALAALLSAAVAAPARGESAASPVSRQFGPGTRVFAQSEAGAGLTFLGTRPGAVIPLQASMPRAAALEAGIRLGPRFGLGPGAALRVAGVEPVRDGSYAARLQQTIDGIPVLGGELAVGLDPAGDLRSIGGELEPSSVKTTPAIEPAAAAKTAVEAVARDTGVAAATLGATSPELAIYDPRILGGPGLSFPSPVWRLEVSSDSRPVTVRELVLVDADLGNVALAFSEIEDAKNRIVCNAKSEPKLVPCTEGLAELVEGGAASAFPQVNAAYELTGALYDFYAEHFGRDSIDGAGMPLISTVSYCEVEECPYENAFWNGEQMVYGDGMVTDDVTGHELTHGVNASESNLFYYYQSGALDESLADIFGELFDLSTPDAPADRWKIGEDSVLGAIRSLSDPPEFGQPDRTGSPDWFFDPNTDFEKGDNGGVHENSGVGGKAAFLMTEGGSFNGQTMTGLGEEKTLQITYDVLSNMLTSASDYQDYGNDLGQACSDLVGEHEITATDCEQVGKVVVATEMEKPPVTAAPATASLCGQGGTAVPAFSDDLENPASGNWATHTIKGPNDFFYPQVPNPLGFDATYARSGTTNIWGYDDGGISDSTIAMTTSVTVPSGGRLHFDHAHGFETGEGNDYDGGVIEYSTDKGATWTDAGSLIEAGDAYGGTIFVGAANPLSGRAAFVGDSAGYGSTRLNLSALAGKQVRFRFRIGTDEAQDDYGWFIDNIEIYHCEGEANPPPPPPEQPEVTPTPNAAPAVQGPARSGDACAAARAALVRAQARVARLRQKLRSMHPPTTKARKAVRRAAADVRRKRAAARRACAP